MSVTQLDSLLTAILRDPDDDGLRLAFADQCEEEGDMARAEFVRVQCTARFLLIGERCDHENDAVADGEGYLGCVECDLRRRERDLLQQHWHDWSGRFATYCFNFHPNRQGAVGVGFRRGFVDEVRCKLADWAGEKCNRCHGRKYLGGPAPGQPGWIGAPPCTTCHGTGRVGGVGAAVMRSQPVTRVVTEKRPYGVNSPVRHSWWNGHRTEKSGYPVSDLPAEVFAKVRQLGEFHGPLGYVYFPTEAAAIDALSAALIRLVKSLY